MEVQKTTIKTGFAAVISRKAGAYFKLLKFRLSLLVVISAIFGYQMAPGVVSWDAGMLLLLSLGGLLVTGASNILNQVLEIDFDRQMKRTQNRPLPTGIVNPVEAVVYALIIGVAGVLILGLYFNLVTALLGVIAFLSYAFVYTPLKRISPIGVLVGAIPGALPPLIGWAAATGSLGAGAWALFLIQFIWQFPHFWAIAWVLHEDYSKAGFKMLPLHKEGQSGRNATIILIYTLMLLPAAILPWQLGLGGIIGLVALIAGGLFMSWQAFRLVRSLDAKDAKKLMFYSFVYLPLVQIGLLIGKI